MGIEQIKDLVQKAIESEGYRLYDCKWVNDGKMKILQIAVMDANGQMDIDTCAKLSGIIGEELDEHSGIESEYYLEVCSPGAERELRSLEDVQTAFENEDYIYIKLRNPANGVDELKGYIKAVEKDGLKVEYKVKNINKKMEVPFENISLIRLSVKI